MQETLSSELCPQPTLEGADVLPPSVTDGEVAVMGPAVAPEHFAQAALLDPDQPPLF